MLRIEQESVVIIVKNLYKAYTVLGSQYFREQNISTFAKGEYSVITAMWVDNETDAVTTDEITIAHANGEKTTHSEGANLVVVYDKGMCAEFLDALMTFAFYKGKPPIVIKARELYVALRTYGESIVESGIYISDNYGIRKVEKVQKVTDSSNDSITYAISAGVSFPKTVTEGKDDTLTILCTEETARKLTNIVKMLPFPAKGNKV